MKLSKITTLGSLFVLASASFHVQEVAVTCTDANPTTVYQTVTVTSTVYNCGGNNQQVTSASVSTNSVVRSSSITNSSTYSTSIPPPPASSTTSSPAKATHSVIVGANGNLIYGPNQLNAAIGDIIRFDFNSTNHTVTQSSFNAPCSPLAGGFNTNFNQVNKLNHTGVIFVDFEVTVDTPLWFYCAQTVKVSHCNKGMVLGVNPAGKFPAFLSMATATGTGMIPLSTGGSKVMSSVVSLNTAGTSSKTSSMSFGTIYTASPKPTATMTSYRIKGRQAADWYN
jgi:plastocyanin